MKTWFVCLGLQFVLLLSLFSIITPNTTIERLTTDEIHPSTVNIESQYSQHEPIVITSNHDFMNQGWVGNGSEISPYLIQNLSIVSDGVCISISTTSVYFKITNCSFTHETERGGSKGVFLGNVHNGVISNCDFLGLFRCIEADMVINVVFANNSFHDEFYGMQLEDSVDCVLMNNEFERVGLWIRGTARDHFLSNRFENNTVEDKPLVVLTNRSSETINASSYGQLFMFNSSNCVVENGTFDYRNVGVSLAFCNNCVILNLKSTYTAICIVELQLCLNTEVTRCDIAGSYNNGFRFTHTVDCSLSDCKAGYSVENPCWGILLYYDMNTTIARNAFQVTGIASYDSIGGYIVDNDVVGRSNFWSPGMTFANSSNLVICGNELHGLEDGIVFAFDSTNGTIFNNRIHDNRGYGIDLKATCKEFRIYNNSFWDNDIENAGDNGISNYWDDGISVGNRWDDYNGVGSYTIFGSAASVDHFPRAISSHTQTTTSTTISTTIPTIVSSTTTMGTSTPIDGTQVMVFVVIISGGGVIVAIFIVILLKKRRSGT